MSKGDGEINEYPNDLVRMESNLSQPASAMLPPSKLLEKDAKNVAKKKGVSLKADIFAKCLDILRLLYQNENYTSLVKVAA